MKKIIIILAIFFFDRLTKIYFINLESTGTEVDFYIYSFLNFYLVWNTGVGFGLASMESNLYYHILTAIIVFINFFLVFYLLKSKGISSYLIAAIIGGFGWCRCTSKSAIKRRQSRVTERSRSASGPTTATNDASTTNASATTNATNDETAEFYSSTG